MSNIHGMKYVRPQTEHQYFPEDYFSGSDVTIYFDDVWVDELMGLEFGLQESVMPVYGYASYTWDAVSRGQRIVNGSFTIAFKEAGYLYRIFEHIAQMKEKSKPMLSNLMNQNEEEKRPQWLAGIKDNIEDLIEHYHSVPTETQEVTDVPTFPIMQLGDHGDDVTRLQQLILNNTSGRFSGLSPIQEYPVQAGLKIGSKGEAVKKLQHRLNGYLYDQGSPYIKKPLVVDGNFGPATQQAVRVFQAEFSNMLDVDGVVGKETSSILSRGLTDYGWYDAPTKLAIMRFQNAHSIYVDGTFEPQTQSRLSVQVDVSTGGGSSSQAEKSFSDYESSIWSEQESRDTNVKYYPHFYGSAKQIEWLPIDGFDIYINYGPLPESIIQNNNSLPESINFNTTVKAIRNIQITGVQQVLSPDGTPIGERYMFMAQDLD